MWLTSNYNLTQDCTLPNISITHKTEILAMMVWQIFLFVFPLSLPKTNDFKGKLDVQSMS